MNYSKREVCECFIFQFKCIHEEIHKTWIMMAQAATKNTILPFRDAELSSDFFESADPPVNHIWSNVIEYLSIAQELWSLLLLNFDEFYFSWSQVRWNTCIDINVVCGTWPCTEPESVRQEMGLTCWPHLAGNCWASLTSMPASCACLVPLLVIKLHRHSGFDLITDFRGSQQSSWGSLVPLR